MAKNAEDLAKLQKQLDQITKKFRELGKPNENPFNNFTADKLLENFKNVDKAAGALDATLFVVNDRLDALNNSTDNLVRQMNAVLDEVSKSSSALGRMNRAYKSLVGVAQDLADESERSTSMNSKDLAKLKDKAKVQSKAAKDQARDLVKEIQLKEAGLKKGEKLSDQDIANRKAAQEILKKDDPILQSLIDKIDARIKLEDKYNEKIGFGGKLASGLDKALQKAGLPALGIADAMEKAKKKFIDSKGETNVLKDTLKGVVGNLKEAVSFANLMQIGFGLLIKSVLEVDKASGEFAKNNGISYQNALAIRGEMNEIARSSNDVVVSSKALMETQGTLNKFFGQSTKFTGKLAEDMTSIAKRTGLSEEAQGTFALEAMKTGKGVKDILKTQTLTVMEMNKEKGLQMSVKQVQEAISKTSNAVFMTFKGSTEELTKQVMSVKALGANMAQVEGIASSLLDFESSIQSELEAELLLGKQINLEKAREAALRGDMGKVAEEVMGNEAIMNAFATDNVIQQEAAAKALGMNRDQLAGMIKEQEKLEAVRGAGFDNMNDAQKEYNKMRAKGYSKEAAAAKIGDDNLAAQLESVSVAERFEATMARVQEVFVALAEPILGIVDGIMTMVGGAEHLANILVGIAGTYALIKAYTLATSVYENVILAKKMAQGSMDARALFLGKSKLAQMVAQAVAFAIMNPFTALAGLAIGAGVGGMIYSQMKDGMIGPDGGMVVSGEKGSIQLDKQDSIIAGTDLLGGGNTTTSDKKGEKGRGAGGGSAALISEVRTLININRQILAKSSVIEMNGNQVGEEINQSERKVQ